MSGLMPDQFSTLCGVGYGRASSREARTALRRTPRPARTVARSMQAPTASAVAAAARAAPPSEPGANGDSVRFPGPPDIRNRDTRRVWLLAAQSWFERINMKPEGFEVRTGYGWDGRASPAPPRSASRITTRTSVTPPSRASGLASTVSHYTIHTHRWDGEHPHQRWQSPLYVPDQAPVRLDHGLPGGWRDNPPRIPPGAMGTTGVAGPPPGGDTLGRPAIPPHSARTHSISHSLPAPSVIVSGVA
eukprot:gene11342-biopygen15407